MFASDMQRDAHVSLISGVPSNDFQLVLTSRLSSGSSSSSAGQTTTTRTAGGSPASSNIVAVFCCRWNTRPVRRSRHWRHWHVHGPSPRRRSHACAVHESAICCHDGRVTIGRSRPTPAVQCRRHVQHVPLALLLLVALDRFCQWCLRIHLAVVYEQEWD